MSSSRTDGIRGAQWLAQERIGVGVTPSGSVFEEYKTACEYVRPAHEVLGESASRHDETMKP